MHSDCQPSNIQNCLIRKVIKLTNKPDRRPKYVSLTSACVVFTSHRFRLELGGFGGSSVR